jgi:hypothetical protein
VKPFEVLYRSDQNTHVVRKVAKSAVAVVAQKAANRAGNMVVIDVQPRFLPVPLCIARRLSADRTTPSLLLHHLFVLIDSNTEVVLELPRKPPCASLVALIVGDIPVSIAMVTLPLLGVDIFRTTLPPRFSDGIPACLALCASSASVASANAEFCFGLDFSTLGTLLLLDYTYHSRSPAYLR